MMSAALAVVGGQLGCVVAGLVFGPDPVLADLPTVMVGPIIHKRQIVAVAKYPGRVSRWSFRFESDDGRAKALVWLHPGMAIMNDCGIFVVQRSLVDPPIDR